MTPVRNASCLWIGIKPSGDIVNGKYIVIPEREEKAMKSVQITKSAVTMLANILIIVRY